MDKNRMAVSDNQIATALLHGVVERVLSDHFGAPQRIVHLQRTPFAYRSSFGLEELQVLLDDGATLTLLWKDASLHALSAAGQRAKPTFLYHPQREIETYHQILGTHLPDAAIYYGALVDEEQARYWLFLEKVQGTPLYEVALPVWQHVARWLATMHGYFVRQPDLRALAAAGHLLHYDRDFYWRWPRRAQHFLHQQAPSLPTTALAQFDRLVVRYEHVIEQLLLLPQTLIHGEFYASNVLVQETTSGLRVCPVDWEMAALGPGLLDLAALVAGQWSEAEKDDLALSYFDEFTSTANQPLNKETFLSALDCCRLHIACQWLGWSGEWSAPAHQAQNWLAEALRVAERVFA